MCSFLSNCNTFVQSLQLNVFAGLEAVGREVPQGSGYREDGGGLWDEAEPQPGLSLVLAKPCEIQLLVVCVKRGIAGPEHGNRSHLLLVLLFFLLFLFRTATIEDPASHLPNIASSGGWPAGCSISILPLRIFLQEVPLAQGQGGGAGGEQRAREAPVA